MYFTCAVLADGTAAIYYIAYIAKSYDAITYHMMELDWSCMQV